MYSRDFVKEGLVETPGIRELYHARNSWSRCPVANHFSV